jgi:hypothetical protein
MPRAKDYGQNPHAQAVRNSRLYSRTISTFSSASATNGK